MARENYYLLLDIDPDRDTTWAAIEPKFRKAIGVWSSQSATHAVPAKRAEYKELLKTKDDIERVLKDDATRKGEADEARKLIVERKTRAVEELEETVRAMATDGYVTPSQVTQLKSRVASKKLTDADVTAALTRLGVPVKAPVVEQTEMRLDDAIAQRIRDTLAQLNKMRAAETPAQPAHDDLYQFLQLAATASNGALLKTAEAEYEKVRNLPKTGDVGLRQNLLGDCLSIFKTPDGRAKYDATLRGMEVEKLLEFVDLAAADKKLVTVKVMEEVIRRGFKAGVAEDRIKQQVKAHAAKKGYSVEVPPSGTIPANTVRCGHCRELIGPTDTSCRKCGRAAKLACPKCGRLNPSEAVTCGEPKCGFPVGDMSRAEGLLRSAKAQFASDPKAAAALLTEALLYWPNHGEATQLLAQIAQREKDRQKYADAVTALFGRREFWAARTAVDDLARNVPDHPRLGEFRAQLAKAVADAEQIAAKAQALEKQGKTDDALDAYQDAVLVCTDLPSAQAGLARCPPAPPTAATVLATPSAVTLRWQASPARGRIVYRVVRKAGSQPTRAADGEEIGRPADLTLTDSLAATGVAYFYAVFADRGGVPSDKPAVAGPVVRVADVTNLRATAGDGKVELSWTPQPNARGVEVWRNAGAAPARGSGTRVATIIGNTANDSGLVNGTTYGYRVVAVYTGADGAPVASAGVTELATPTAPPRAVTDLRVSRDGSGYFEAVWSRPPVGEVRVYRLAKPANAPFRVGQMLQPGDLDKLGPRVPAAGPAIARDKAGPSEVLHLFPVTVAGTVAVAGQLVSQSWVADVTDFTASSDGKTVRCRWTFPDQVNLLHVLVRTDRPAESPTDPAAEKHTYTRDQAKSDGGFRCLLPPKAETAFVTVYAVINREGAWHYSEGKTARVAARGRCRVRYRAGPEKRLGFFSTGNWQLTITVDTPCELPELQLVGKPGGFPLSLADGQPVATVPACTVTPAKSVQVAFPPPGLAAGNLRLFPSDPTDTEWLELLAQK